MAADPLSSLEKIRAGLILLRNPRFGGLTGVEASDCVFPSPADVAALGAWEELRAGMSCTALNTWSSGTSTTWSGEGGTDARAGGVDVDRAIGSAGLGGTAGG